MGVSCGIAAFALVPLCANQNKMFSHCSQKSIGFQLWQIFRKTQLSHKCYLQFRAPYTLLQALQLNYSNTTG